MHRRMLVGVALVAAFAPSRAVATPSAPTNLTAAPTSGSGIALAWTDTSGNEDHFDVQRSLDGSSFASIGTAPANVTSYQDFGLSSGVLYYYRVRAAGKGSTRSSWSNVASAVPVAVDSIRPGVPAGVTAAAASCSQVNVSWYAATDTGGSGLRGYNVYRQGLFLKQILAPTTSTSDAGLAASTAYTYNITAVDNAGNQSAASLGATATTPSCTSGDRTPPSTPTGVTATAASCSQINVSWNAASDTGGSGLKGYNIYRGGLFVKQVLAPATSTADTGLAGGTSYTYNVSAVDNAGNASPASIGATGSTPACADTTAPTMPTGLSATAPSCSQVNLSWAASSDTGGSGLKGYNIYRGGVLLKLVSAPATSTLDAGLAGGTLYSYTASAVDNAGNQSARSATASTNTPACPSTGGQVVWQRDLGGSGTFMQGAWVKGMAVDPRTGNMAVTGQFQGPVNFGGGTLTSADGSVDLFVAKYGGSNAYLWSRRYGNGAGAGEAGSAVAMDSIGNVIVTGFITSYAAANVGGGSMTASGVQDIFLAKYAASDGSPVWVKQIGGIGTDSPAAVAVDSADNIVLTGYFQNSVNFGNVTLTSAGGADVFVAKYSPTGVLQWVLRAGGASGDVPTGLALDTSNNVLVTGSFQGSANFGGGSLTSAGSTDIFLAKYSASGTHLWSQRFGSTSDDVGYGVAADPAGNVILVGDFMGSVDFGGGALQSAGPGAMVLAKYGPSGGHVWSKRFGSTLSGAHGQAVAADGGGNVAVTGTISSAVDFGGGALRDPLGDNPDVFVARFTSAGAYVWAKRAGVLNDDRGVAVRSDASNNVIATGTFTDSVDFGAGAMSSPGGEDSFVVEFSP